MTQKLKYALLGFLTAALGLWGLAVTIPNTFSSGEVVSAAKMNQNFQALEDAVDALEAKAAALEAELTALPERTAMPRAMAIVVSDGSLSSSFSLSGGGVSATQTGTGMYTVNFTGEVFSTSNNPMSVTTLQIGRVCSATAFANTGEVYIDCVDMNGNRTDTSFHLIVFNE